MSTAEAVDQRQPPLTKYPSASIRELVKLSLPLIAVLLSSCLMNFIDRLFLAHFSFEAFEGCVNAVYLCMLFQLPCMRITSMAQIFIGFHKGANHPNLIGECVWQMIWFSILSMIITLPLGSITGAFFLGGTAIEKPAMTYLQTLMFGNFLFPLGAALSSFYIAKGNTKVLVLATICAQLLNIGLDYLLIFGVEGILPAQGIFGAALATIIAQSSFCAILFWPFLKNQFHQLYGTRNWALHWKPFWNYVQVGIPRAIARLLVLVAWAATARIMTLKGGDFLIVFSVGGTLFLVFAFINEGLGQAIMTIASRLIGAKEYLTLRKLRRSSFLFLAFSMACLTLPFLIFPDFLLSFFFSEPPSSEVLTLLHRSCYWIWIMLLGNGFNMIGFGLISAACDTVFHMMANSLVWLTSYLPIYLIYNMTNCPPDIFWLIIALEAFLIGSIFHWRVNRNDSKHSSFEKCHFNLL